MTITNEFTLIACARMEALQRLYGTTPSLFIATEMLGVAIAASVKPGFEREMLDELWPRVLDAVERSRRVLSVGDAT